MPFDSRTAQAVGRTGGLQSAAKRWADKDPATVRNRAMRLAVSSEELDMMDTKAAAVGISRTELIVRAVRKY